MSSTASSLFRPIVVIPAALLFLCAAAAMVWYAVNIDTGRRADIREAAPVIRRNTSILVSLSDIARGQVLTGGDIALRTVSAGQVPDGALHNIADAQWRVALAPIAAGSPITVSQISTAALDGISVRVPAGYRAYAIAVSEADIAGGFLQVGDRVDLYVTLPGALFGDRVSADGARDMSRSALLLQGVQVLAVGTKLQTKGDDAQTGVRTVTVALQADALAKVALARRLGNVSFALRNPADRAEIRETTADIGTILGTAQPHKLDPAQRPTAARANRAGITVFAGREKSVMRVP